MKSGFAPLSHWMQKKNSDYYKSKKTKIYSDFLTYAQDKEGMLTKANAQEFYSWACRNEKERYDVLEVGVGEGAFCIGFLSEIRRLDRKNGTAILKKIKYTLADFSNPMIAKAQKNIKKEGFGESIKAVLLDANAIAEHECGALSDSITGLSSYDLIRCNELFSDIPANAYVCHGERIFEAMYASRMAIELAETDIGEEIEGRLVSLMPEGYAIPINSAAAEAAAFFASHLKDGGWMDIFDYGFYFKDDFSMPANVWNLSLVRQYGTQWTVDLNFLYLSVKLASLGYGSETERQAGYVEHISGEKLSLDENGGLGYKRAQKGGAGKEDDFFYHLRVRKE